MAVVEMAVAAVDVADASNIWCKKLHPTSTSVADVGNTWCKKLHPTSTSVADVGNTWCKKLHPASAADVSTKYLAPCTCKWSLD